MLDFLLLFINCVIPNYYIFINKWIRCEISEYRLDYVIHNNVFNSILRKRLVNIRFVSSFNIHICWYTSI